MTSYIFGKCRAIIYITMALLLLTATGTLSQIYWFHWWGWKGSGPACVNDIVFSCQTLLSNRWITKYIKETLSLLFWNMDAINRAYQYSDICLIFFFKIYTGWRVFISVYREFTGTRARSITEREVTPSYIRGR